MTLIELIQILTDAYPEAHAQNHFRAASALLELLDIPRDTPENPLDTLEPDNRIHREDWETDVRRAIFFNDIEVLPNDKIMTIRNVRDWVRRHHGYPALRDVADFVDSYLDENHPL